LDWRAIKTPIVVGPGALSSTVSFGFTSVSDNFRNLFKDQASPLSTGPVLRRSLGLGRA
jgi:hypothetical protein